MANVSQKQWSPPKPSFCSPKPTMVANKIAKYMVDEDCTRANSPSDSQTRHTSMLFSSCHASVDDMDSSRSGSSAGMHTAQYWLEEEQQRTDEPMERMLSWTFQGAANESVSSSPMSSVRYAYSPTQNTPILFSPRSNSVYYGQHSYAQSSSSISSCQSVFEGWEDDGEEKQVANASEDRFQSPSPFASVKSWSKAGARASPSHKRLPSRETASTVRRPVVESSQSGNASSSRAASLEHHSSSSTVDMVEETPVRVGAAARLRNLSSKIRRHDASSSSSPSNKRKGPSAPSQNTAINSPVAEDQYFKFSGAPQLPMSPLLRNGSTSPLIPFSSTHNGPAQSSLYGLGLNFTPQCGFEEFFEETSNMEVEQLSYSTSKSPSTASLNTNASFQSFSPVVQTSVLPSTSPNRTADRSQGKLPFDPARRPRAPFPPSAEVSVAQRAPAPSATLFRPVPLKAAALLGTEQGMMLPAIATPSPFTSQAFWGPNQMGYDDSLPPCPDRMNLLHELVRPKPDRPAKSVERAPPRPPRPTESNIFAGLDQAELHSLTQYGHIAASSGTTEMTKQRPQRSPRRQKTQSKPLPPPKSPLPPVPVEKERTRVGDVVRADTSLWSREEISTGEEVITDRSLAAHRVDRANPLLEALAQPTDKATQTFRSAVAVVEPPTEPFKAKMFYTGVGTSIDGQTVVQLNVGGMSFSSTFAHLSSSHASNGGLATLLDSFCNTTNVELSKDSSRSNSIIFFASSPNLMSCMLPTDDFNRRNTVNSYIHGHSEEADRDSMCSMPSTIHGESDEEDGASGCVSIASSSVQVHSPHDQPPFGFRLSTTSSNGPHALKRSSNEGDAVGQTLHSIRQVRHVRTPTNVSSESVDNLGMDSPADTFDVIGNTGSLARFSGLTGRSSITNAKGGIRRSGSAHNVISQHESDRRTCQGRDALRGSASSVSLDKASYACLTPLEPRFANEKSQDGGLSPSAVPAFTFAPSATLERSLERSHASTEEEEPAHLDVPTMKETVHVSLSVQRNPLFYPAILYALENHALPPFFHSLSTAKEQSGLELMLQGVRKESLWLGYFEIAAICQTLLDS